MLLVSRALWIVFAMGCLLIAVSSPAFAAGQDSDASDRPIAFDIAPEPLGDALAAFSAVTGIEVLVDARNVEGHQSAGIVGPMPARKALQVLLAGTPLEVQEFAPGTVTLMRVAKWSAIDPKTTSASAWMDAPYFHLIQRAVLRALCRSGETVPGSYRLALKLWIEPSGVISQVKRLDTLGDPDRNAAVDTALRQLDIGSPAPPDLPQPIAVVILPHASRDTADCPPLIPRQDGRSMDDAAEGDHG
jgi:hypothetical protein